MYRGGNRAATNAFRQASIAPEPTPTKNALAHTPINTGVTAYPTNPAVASSVLTSSTVPTPSRFANAPAEKLDSTYPADPDASTTPRK